MTDRRCGYAVTDHDGHQEPCDQPATGHRWYQDVEHEDLLDVACEIHKNPGGYRMASAEADRDRARSIAVALEQEVAELQAQVAHLHAALGVCGREVARYRREASVMHSVVEQVGLLVERYAYQGLPIPPAKVQDILDGATFEEVTHG